MFHAWDDRVDEVLRTLGSEATDVLLDRENEFLRAELTRAREESERRLTVIRDLETLAHDRGRWNAELEGHVSLRDDRIADLVATVDAITKDRDANRDRADSLRSLLARRTGERDEQRANVVGLLATLETVERERDAVASECRVLEDRLAERTAERDLARARSEVLDRLLAKERETTAALAAEIARFADPVAVALDAARATRDRVARRWRRRP